MLTYKGNHSVDQGTESEDSLLSHHWQDVFCQSAKRYYIQFPTPSLKPLALCLRQMPYSWSPLQVVPFFYISSTVLVENDTALTASIISTCTYACFFFELFITSLNFEFMMSNLFFISWTSILISFSLNRSLLSSIIAQHCHFSNFISKSWRYNLNRQWKYRGFT